MRHVLSRCLCAIATAGWTTAAGAQQFSPSERALLYQPGLLDPGAGGFAPADKTKRRAPAAQTRSQAKTSAGVSLSSELNAGRAPATGAPALRRSEAPQPEKPWDRRVPFGPLSLGLQAEPAPRSDALATPTPSGLDQFRKDRIEPYVGLSIIDIKR